MDFTKREPMEVIGVRIPGEIREQAKKLALSHGVSESEVYRTIIAKFFSSDSEHSVHEIKNTVYLNSDQSGAN